MDGHGHAQAYGASRYPPSSNALPSISSLTSGVPPSSQTSPHSLHKQQPPPRDSGAWVGSQSSKHTSANSGLHVSTLLNPDEPNVRVSIPSTPSSSRHSQPTQTLPSINQSFEPNNVQRDSYTSLNSHGAHESRRSSVDSRMHSGISGLALGNSHVPPYESQHASQVSLSASLRRPDLQNQLSPLGSRSTPRAHEHSSVARVAPPIVPNPRQYGAPDPTAVKPTQGFPWAFPDIAGPLPSDDRSKHRASSSDSDDDTDPRSSRKNSFAASSVRSSAISGEMAMPAGQRRFEEGMGFQKIIGPAPTDVKHQHADPSHGANGIMQHRSITQLQNEHMMNGVTGGYSRTPELRVSHKLAERKRRSEMKDLFDDLNKAVPSNVGAKSSKWEILSKAIDYIKSQRDNERFLHDEMNRFRLEVDKMRELRNEVEQLRHEGGVMHARLQRLEPHEPHIYGGYTSQLSQQSQRAPQPMPPSGPQQHGQLGHPGGLASVNSSHSHTLTHQHPQQSYQSHSGPPHPQHPSQSSQQQQGYYSQAPQSNHMQGVEYSLPTRPGYEGR